MAVVHPRYSSSNVRQDVFPLGHWTITTRKGIIMQSKCTCKNATNLPASNQQQQDQYLEHQLDKEADKEPIELCDICRYHLFLPQLHTMPDMLFNKNLFRLEHFSGVGIEFNPLDALRLVKETSDPLRVAVADGWQSARADCPFAKQISRPFDWTFTTNYRGTLLSAVKKSSISSVNPKTNASSNELEVPNRSYGKTQDTKRSKANEPSVIDGNGMNSETTAHNQASSAITLNSVDQNKFSDDMNHDRYSFSIEKTDERIDVNKLKVKEDILFYDDVTLYEDELADHGTAQYSVKVRVMPNSFFVLARYYLRIDGVMARINDTRIYHELKQGYILREYTNREAKFSGLNLPISTIVNPSELMSHLPLIEKCYEKLILPAAATK